MSRQQIVVLILNECGVSRLMCTRGFKKVKKCACTRNNGNMRIMNEAKNNENKIYLGAM